MSLCYPLEGGEGILHTYEAYDKVSVGLTEYVLCWFYIKGIDCSVLAWSHGGHLISMTMALHAWSGRGHVVWMSCILW